MFLTFPVYHGSLCGCDRRPCCGVCSLIGNETAHCDAPRGRLWVRILLIQPRLGANKCAHATPELDLYEGGFRATET